ncbi:MAG: 2-polyprenyl-3-methyl-6-methoxy-1,4-benzoquinone monooxygenase [Gammaproteobacteria bacterium]
MAERRYTPLDTLIVNLDKGVRTVFGQPPRGGRPRPGQAARDDDAPEADRRVSVGLMRVNHAGEVAAQALYHGQAITARDPVVRDRMSEAAAEENDHLSWCEARLEELGGHTSYLSPLWYLGSFTFGVVAGCAGDRFSLGFLAETERQVVAHLEGHMARLPQGDVRSRGIIEQMKKDESYHATVAVDSGAVDLPVYIKRLMRMSAKVMTTTAYWV